MDEPILVTRSMAPESGVYEQRISGILDRHTFTNNGPECLMLEDELSKFLQTPWLALCTSGTLGLEIAIHAAGLAGKTLVTTPFSYVATISAALWVGCRIIFADIDPETLSLDPRKIPDPAAFDGLLPVNIYGHPCAYEELASFGKPVIYDAAQAFGASLEGRPLPDFGDFAVCSFHATKVFHTLEGGLVVCHSAQDLERLRLLRAFGHQGDTHKCLGINAKMSEAHAAMGLALLPEFQPRLEERKRLSGVYQDLLDTARLRYPLVRQGGFKSNYGYFPVIFETERLALQVMGALMEKRITPRRYFYPALSELPYIQRQPCPIAEDISRRVLCLPLYASLGVDNVERIAAIVNSVCRQ